MFVHLKNSAYLIQFSFVEKEWVDVVEDVVEEELQCRLILNS